MLVSAQCWHFNTWCIGGHAERKRYILQRFLWRAWSPLGMKGKWCEKTSKRTHAQRRARARTRAHSRSSLQSLDGWKRCRNKESTSSYHCPASDSRVVSALLLWFIWLEIFCFIHFYKVCFFVIQLKGCLTGITIRLKISSSNAVSETQ